MHELAQKTLDLFLPGAFNWGSEAHDNLEKTFEVMHGFARVSVICAKLQCPVTGMITLL